MTDHAPAPANMKEIAAVKAEVAASAPPPPPPTSEPQLPPVGAERPRVEVHEGKPPGQSTAEETLDDLDKLAREKNGEKLEAMLRELDEEDLVDVVMLGFSWPEGKEITEKRARRIAHYLHRVIQRHADSLKWLVENIPEVMLGLLVGYELWIRFKDSMKEAPAHA